MPPYKKTSSWKAYDSNYGKVQITWNPDLEAYETSFPYNEQFIAWIKSNINTNERSLDFDRNRNPQYKWIFSQKIMENVVLPMMKNMFFTNCTFNIIDKKKVDEYNQGFKQTKIVDTNALKQEFRALVTAAGVSTELPDKKQYRLAAMHYHPDRNPENGSKMSRLNEIWSTVFEPKIVELV